MKLLLDQNQSPLLVGVLASRATTSCTCVTLGLRPPADRQSRPSGVPVGHDPDTDRLTPVERLDEVPGIAGRAAQIIAEVGLDMSRFPTPAHLVSWAKLSPQTIQSGPKVRAGKTGKDNLYLKGGHSRTLGDTQRQ